MQHKVPNIRIKDEIKYLYTKKQQLNLQIYHLHLSLANSWKNTWPYIQHTIESKLQREVQFKYKNLDKKLCKLAQTQTTKPRQKHTFHPTSIFSNEEMTLLQKAPKYNIHSKQKNWLQNLALEAETAITQLPTTDRDVYRKLVADRINTLQRNCNPNPRHNTHPESRTIKTIQAKLQENNAIITRADKGNSLVILPSQQYKSKVHSFLQANRFQTTSTDPTKTYQNLIGKTINDSKTLIPQDSRWRYINLNPSAPTIKGLMKIHKPDQPIRPIVNWHNAPSVQACQTFHTKDRSPSCSPIYLQHRKLQGSDTETKTPQFYPTSRLHHWTSPTYTQASQSQKLKKFCLTC